MCWGRKGAYHRLGDNNVNLFREFDVFGFALDDGDDVAVPAQNSVPIIISHLNIMNCRKVQFSSVQFSSVQFRSVQFSSVQYSKFSSVQFSSVLGASMHFGSAFLLFLRMMLVCIDLDFIGHYLLSSIIILRVQFSSLHFFLQF